MKPRAIVVGSGAGGATAARALQGTFDVTVLEAGGSFRPLSFDLRTIERLKRSRLVFDPRLIRVPFPATHAQPHARGDGARERFVRRRDDDDRDRQRPADGRRSPSARSRPRRGVRGDRARDPGLDRPPARLACHHAQALRRLRRPRTGSDADAEDGRPRTLPALRSVRARVPRRREVGRAAVRRRRRPSRGPRHHAVTGGPTRPRARRGDRRDRSGGHPQTVPPGRPRGARGRRLRNPADPRTIRDPVRSDALRRPRPHRRRPAITGLAVQGDRDAVRRAARRLHPVSLLRLPELPVGTHVAGRPPAIWSA